MNTENLNKSPIKNKYFSRTEKWDWLNKDMIQVFDSKNPRIITMDIWPQTIYLDATGELTVSEYISNFAKKYPSNQIPVELADTILDTLLGLIDDEKIIQLSDNPVILDESIYKQMTELGEIDLVGIWKGSYTYNLPDEFKDLNMQEVEFTIKINNVKGNKFKGTVEDNLKTGGTPGIGNIIGSFTDQTITFDKKMPIHAIVDQNNKHYIDENKKHPTILYEGKFSRSKKHITGTWRFKKRIIIWKGLIPIWHSSGNGTFTMRKEN